MAKKWPVFNLSLWHYKIYNQPQELFKNLNLKQMYKLSKLCKKKKPENVQHYLILYQTTPTFNKLHERSPVKTLWKKKKMLTISIFFF